MRRVILVDDEFWALRGLETLFPWAEHGYTPIGSFDDPVDALEAILAEKPELVITDIRMPELSGLDLLRAARERGVESVFVIVSGYGEFEYAQAALRHGAFDYLLKPVSFETADALLGRLDARLTKNNPTAYAQPGDAAGAGEHMNELIRYVRGHYSEPLQLKDLAGRFYLNPTYCSELFNKVTGMSFPKFINALRLDRCCSLLRTTTLAIDQIARQAGFTDYSNFHKVFKAALGTSPLQYRRQGKPSGRAERASSARPRC